MIPGGNYNPSFLSGLISRRRLCMQKVVQHTSGLECGQVVSITQYHPQNRIGPPIAVGKMVVPSSSLEGEPDIKGKAVFVLHTWKDHLWDIGNGRKTDLPDPREASSPENNESGLKQEDDKAHEIREEHSIHNNTGTNVEAEEDRRTGDVSHTPSETEIIPELVLTPEGICSKLLLTLAHAVFRGLDASS